MENEVVKAVKVEKLQQLHDSWITLSDYIQANKAVNQLTANVVYAYAHLLLKDDSDLPILPAMHHRLWMDLVCDESIRRLLIISPPDSAKTTWLVSAYLGAYIGFYPHKSVIIGCVDGSTAEKRSISLRNMTETPQWQTIFPNVIADTSMKRERVEWTVALNGQSALGRINPSVRSYGTGASIIGSRADFLLGDDLLDTNNTRTKAGRDTFAIWFESMFLSRMKAQTGRCVVIGTSWNADDYYARIRRNPAGWSIVHVPSMIDDDSGFYAHITEDK